MAMSKASRIMDAQRPELATLRAAQVAGKQWGVIGRGQLRGCGVSERAITRRIASGRLHPIFRGVYAFGHASIPIEGELVATLLHAGPEVVLSHRTAAWWWGLID